MYCRECATSELPQNLYMKNISTESRDYFNHTYEKRHTIRFNNQSNPMFRVKLHETHFVSREIVAFERTQQPVTCQNMSGL
ncbi:hypothetical protein Y032_0413g1015 [Ancylostoma ceylanicum]|uniref:Uncharacterized protein n=1 Tax=Ancylostoma ceylanicum TaxID=53326 RepID=A0A016X242_9BILA|nr:hypothetical protein Y032_0413g1015 [Ancylostoma ceylanicum]